MKYDIIDERNKNHIKTLLKWLFDEVVSAGGDGDAIWYSQFYSIENILEVVKEINNELKWKWEVDILENSDKETYILWGEGQEAIIITNNEKMWKKRPSWQQCSICY